MLNLGVAWAGSGGGRAGERPPSDHLPTFIISSFLPFLLRCQFSPFALLQQFPLPPSHLFPRARSLRGGHYWALLSTMPYVRTFAPSPRTYVLLFLFGQSSAHFFFVRVALPASPQLLLGGAGRGGRREAYRNLRSA